MRGRWSGIIRIGEGEQIRMSFGASSSVKHKWGKQKSKLKEKRQFHKNREGKFICFAKIEGNL